MARFPELRRARLAGAIERTDANHGFDLVWGWHDAAIEIRQRRELAPATFIKDAVLCALGESLHASQGHTDGLSFDGELRAGAVHARWQYPYTEPVTLQHINQRAVETLSVAQHGGHELDRVIPLEPRALIRLHA